MFHFRRLEIPDLVEIQPDKFQDERGYFLETYREDVFSASGIPTAFVQDNQSSSRRGVLRGLHYQIQQSQGKLVRVLAGEIFDVAVDLRCSSATFGRWSALALSAAQKNQLWIPPGFAHGFYVLSEVAEIYYKATDYYAPQWERTLLWNDPVIGICWPFSSAEAPVLSAKDAAGEPLPEAETYP